MEPREILKLETQCIEDHLPGCSGGCPLHLDCRGIIALICRREYAQAWQLLARDGLLPRLLAAGCSGPCQQFCSLSHFGEPLNLPQLEQWLLQQEIARHGLLPLTIQPYLQLTQMVAVVGGGAAGLAAAAFLYQKGFRVTIYEQSSVLGGSLKKNPGISAPLLRAELAFFTENCNIKLNCRVGWDISLATLCALYPGIVLAVPTGEDVGLGAGQLAYDPLTLQLQTDPRLFWAGLPPQGDVSLAGRFACAKQGAISVDRYAKQVSLTASRWRGGSYRSDLPVNLPGQSRPTVIAGGGGYTETEAVAEAGRCLDCHCRECLRQCRMLEKFGKTPRQYIREIANNLIITMGIRKANMMINSCSQCGLCRDVCPNGLDMGGVFLAARENMVKKGNMPERVYDFPLRDMLFSVSGEFDLWREDPAGGADYLFFPGCQLAAGAPQYIAPLYQHLRQILPGGVGLGLSCCGAPAHWAGQQELKQQTREKLMAEWRRLGQPILITGCTTCYQEFLPVIGAEKLTTVWDVLAQYGLPPQETALPGHVFAIHDPCTSRQMGETQANLRKIAVQLGCRIREMPHSGADTRCCGYGGLAIFGNPQLTQELQQQRLAETDQDLLTYCWVCRDYLGAAAEKQGRYGTVYHLMDLLFGGGIPAPRADISTKRANRRWLKQELLQQLWGEGTSPVSSLQKYRLVAGLPLLLEQRLILIEDIAAVVEQAEQSGYKLIRPGVGHYIAHLRRGIVTYWVEYSITAEGYLIHNAYSHRIQLLTEGLNY